MGLYRSHSGPKSDYSTWHYMCTLVFLGTISIYSHYNVQRICRYVLYVLCINFKSAVDCLHFLTIKLIEAETNGRHFADDTFGRIFLNENLWTLLKNSLKIVPKVRINNIPALVQIMAWRRLGDKPLSEPMMVRLLTHICVTRPQWVNHCVVRIDIRYHVNWKIK